jgi:replication factor C subunit 3/5
MSSKKNIKRKYKINPESLTDNNFFENHNINDNPKNINDLPWIEKYRPKTLSNVAAHDHIKVALTNYITNKSFPHLLLDGPAGTGKTSTILACAKDMYKDQFPYMVMEFNASDERGVDVVREKIKSFVHTKNFFCSGPKLVILDEIDSMTVDAQKILRRVIEKYSQNARFCLICNYVSKIINALQSRCTNFRFAPLLNEQIKERLLWIVENEKINITDDGLETIMKISNGDMRKTINILQSTSMIYDNIGSVEVYSSTNSFNQNQIKNIISLMNEFDCLECYNKIFALLKEYGIDLNNLLIYIKDYIIDNDMDVKKKIYLIDHLATIEFQNTVTTNDKLQLAGLIGMFKLINI